MPFHDLNLSEPISPLLPSKPGQASGPESPSGKIRSDLFPYSPWIVRIRRADGRNLSWYLGLQKIQSLIMATKRIYILELETFMNP